MAGDQPGAASAAPRAPALPVTLLTGFLGAGKTTRLNATLTSGREKVAVIENEIGALSVDSELVSNRHDDGIIELTNGCLCCSAEVDLVSALESLAHRRTHSPFDRVIIETTGLADVAPVIELISDPQDPLASDFFLDGVVTVVDAANFHRWVGEGAVEAVGAGPVATWASGFGAPAGGTGQEAAGAPAWQASSAGLGRQSATLAFWKQVALADQILVSKGDVAGEQAVQELQHVVAQVNPLAELLADARDAGAALPPPRALEDQERKGLVAAAALAARRGPPKVSLCGASQKRRKGADHLAGVSALTLRLPAGCLLRADALRDFVAALLAGGERSGGVDAEESEGVGEAWRVKGLVAVEGMGPALLQCVGEQVSLEPWPRECEEPFLVVIGERLSRERVEEALLACAAEASAPLTDAV